MSRATTADRDRLSALLHSVAGRCVFCSCQGQECKTATGEPCELVGELQNRCSGVACEVRYFGEKRDAKRGKVFKVRRLKAGKGRAA